MEILTKQEFAAKCGKTTKWLSNYITRGKIAVVGEKIDITIPINSEFLTKWATKNDAPPTKNDAQQLTDNTSNNFQNQKNSVDGKSMAQIERDKKIADLEKTLVETRLKLMQEQQKKGENIPTDQVKMIVTHLSKSFTTKFHQAADNFLMEIGKKKDLSREEMAQMRGALISVINEASTVAVEEAKRNIKAAQNETAIKKGVGEHG